MSGSIAAERENHQGASLLALAMAAPEAMSPTEWGLLIERMQYAVERAILARDTPSHANNDMARVALLVAFDAD